MLAFIIYFGLFFLGGYLSFCSNSWVQAVGIFLVYMLLVHYEVDDFDFFSKYPDDKKAVDLD